MSFARDVRVALVALVAVAVTGCGIITFAPYTGPDIRHAEDSTSIPKPTPFREDCTRHITAAHAAMVMMSTPDSVHMAAHAHGIAVHEYHVCLARQP